MEYVITASGLSKKYMKVRAVDELNIKVPKGAIYGLVGKNGAGKTTFMRVITGLTEPSGGAYSLYGVENGDKEILKVRRRIGAMVDKPFLYKDMTVRGNLKQQRILYGVLSKEIVDEVIKLVGLEKVARKKVGKLSLGMRQRLGIAMALVGSPDLLILDEPINGLDPQGVIELRELLLKLNREKQTTILISSHILGELSKPATHYGFIHNGKIIKEISAAELEMSMDKCVEVEVSDTMLLSRALDKLGKKYEIMSNTTARIYGELTATEVFKALDGENCEIISMNNINRMDANLENYFINLVGGGQYE